MSNIEEDRIEFDGLNYAISAIDVELSFAPENHSELYKRALLNSFGQAHEFLASRPELVEVIQTMGHAAVVLAEEEKSAKQSLFRLTEYANKGLLESRDVPLPQYEAYAPTDFEAFDTLYGDLVPEPVIETVVEEDDIEEEDTAVEDINALDILEHLERKGFDSAALALVKNALELTPTSLTELRKNDWELLKLSKEDFETFTRRAPDVLRNAVKLLQEVGVSAKWSYDDVKKKKLFRLVIGSVAEQEQAFDPRAGLRQLYGDTVGREVLKDPSTNRVHRPGHTELTKSSTDTSTPILEEVPEFEVSQVMSIIRRLVNGGEVRWNMIRRNVAEGTGKTRLESDQVLRALQAEEYIFKNGAKEGTPIVSLTKPETNGRNTKAPTSESDQENQKKELVLLTPDEVKETDRIFRALVKLRYQSKGMILTDLSTQLNVDSEVLRLLCAKLIKQGFLITQQRHLQSGSPRARKNRTASFFMFPTQQAWNEYKADSTEYLGRIEITEAVDETV